MRKIKGWGVKCSRCRVVRIGLIKAIQTNEQVIHTILCLGSDNLLRRGRVKTVLFWDRLGPILILIV